MISDGTLKAGIVVKSIQVGRFWIEFEVKDKKDRCTSWAPVKTCGFNDHSVKVNYRTKYMYM